MSSESLDQQLREATYRQMAHVNKSMRVDRRGWTQQQWIDDARSLFNDPHGSVLSLVNGHVVALLSEIDRLSKERTP
jgi:hypothetical protein